LTTLLVIYVSPFIVLAISISWRESYYTVLMVSINMSVIDVHLVGSFHKTW